jgi:hypothetical protein
MDRIPTLNVEICPSFRATSFIETGRKPNPWQLKENLNFKNMF